MNEWITAWGCCTLDFHLFQTLIGNETQRILLKNNLDGDAVRLHFSNRFGVETATYDRVTLALSRDMMTADRARIATVTFGGDISLSLEPGQEATSDAIDFPMRAGENLAVTTYMAGRCVITSGASSYPQPLSRVYNSLPGDYSIWPYFPIQPQTAYFRPVKDEPEISFLYGLDRVDVWARSGAKTITCFGDSITHQSRWTGPFADRVYRARPGACSVVNCGIGGNRILHDAYPLSGYGGLFGEAGVKRFERDVFGAGTRVDLVIMLEGVNDILHPGARYAPETETVDSGQLIEGLKTFARACRARGAKMVACTLMPFYNFRGCWTEAREAVRQRVNDWIRGGGCDGFLDFDALTRDPGQPVRLKSLCDSGDHIHPGQAGGVEIAYGIDLERLWGILSGS